MSKNVQWTMKTDSQGHIGNTVFVGWLVGKLGGRMVKARCGPWLFLCEGVWFKVYHDNMGRGRYDDHEIPNMDNILPWWSCIAVVRSTVIPVMVATMKMLIHARFLISVLVSVWVNMLINIMIMMLSTDSYLVVNDLWQEAAEARCRSCIKERRGWRLTKDLFRNLG